MGKPHANYWRDGDTREAAQVRRYLDINEAARQSRRNLIRAQVGHPLSHRTVERIVALSTGLQALYDLGENQDAVICRYLRRHAGHDFDELLNRATWVFVAQ